MYITTTRNFNITSFFRLQLYPVQSGDCLHFTNRDPGLYAAHDLLPEVDWQQQVQEVRQALDHAQPSLLYLQITHGHLAAQGHRGSCHGVQAAQPAALPTWIRDPSGVVHLLAAVAEPCCLLLFLLWISKWRLEGHQVNVWMSSTDGGRKVQPGYQIQRGGNHVYKIVNFKDPEIEHAVAKLSNSQNGTFLLIQPDKITVVVQPSIWWAFGRGIETFVNTIWRVCGWCLSLLFTSRTLRQKCFKPSVFFQKFNIEPKYWSN